MSDKINLTIPAKPDYLLTARLVASSVASRMGFDVNDSEDIKTAVAEALLLMIHQQKFSHLETEFLADEKNLSIKVQGVEGKAEVNEYISEDNSLGRYLIEALADESEFLEDDGIISKIIISKKLQR